MCVILDMRESFEKQNEHDSNSVIVVLDANHLHLSMRLHELALQLKWNMLTLFSKLTKWRQITHEGIINAGLIRNEVFYRKLKEVHRV